VRIIKELSKPIITGQLAKYSTLPINRTPDSSNFLLVELILHYLEHHLHMKFLLIIRTFRNSNERVRVIGSILVILVYQLYVIFIIRFFCIDSFD